MQGEQQPLCCRLAGSDPALLLCDSDWVELELEAELAEAKRIAQAMTPPMLKIRAA